MMSLKYYAAAVTPVGIVPITVTQTVRECLIITQQITNLLYRGYGPGKMEGYDVNKIFHFRHPRSPLKFDAFYFFGEIVGNVVVINWLEVNRYKGVNTWESGNQVRIEAFGDEKSAKYYAENHFEATVRVIRLHDDPPILGVYPHPDFERQMPASLIYRLDQDDF